MLVRPAFIQRRLLLVPFPNASLVQFTSKLLGFSPVRLGDYIATDLGTPGELLAVVSGSSSCGCNGGVGVGFVAVGKMF